MNNYKTIIAAVAAGLACTAATSHATIVPKSGLITTVLPNSATTPPGGSLGGSLLAQELVQISNPTGGNDGTIDSWVLSGVSAAAGGVAVRAALQPGQGADDADSGVECCGWGE